MKRFTKAALPFVVVSALALAGCSSDDADTANAEGSSDALSGTVTLYTSEPQEKIDEIIAGFTEQHPDVTVETFRAGTGELTARIATEQETGEVQADVLLAADVPTFEAYVEDDMLAPLEVDNVTELDETYVDSEGYWVGTRVIPTVLAYNTDVVDSPPESWQELTDEEYAGQISMPNPDVSGAAAFNAAVWLDDENLGEDWLDDVMDNDPTILESNGPVGQAVADGTTGVGVVVDYLARELGEQGSPIDLVYPTDGAPYVSQPAGVFSDTENPEVANAFIDYLISEEGQTTAVEQSYLPVRSDVGVPEGAPEMDDLELLDPDLDHIAEIQSESVDHFNSLLN
ncbi:ABC transporter substrate-binding protein [Yaniella flava]|uniref:ABC transporter substrate-binding protein n=1 Tax=Yaniella flava TaxID=287930 RepID=A0ABP5FSW3_9MICC|nr:ABC transporter substrate-binding protein [Micrococcaceae bacterium]